VVKVHHQRRNGIRSIESLYVSLSVSSVQGSADSIGMAHVRSRLMIEAFSDIVQYFPLHYVPRNRHIRRYHYSIFSIFLSRSTCGSSKSWTGFTVQENKLDLIIHIATSDMRRPACLSSVAVGLAGPGLYIAVGAAGCRGGTCASDQRFERREGDDNNRCAYLCCAPCIWTHVRFKNMSNREEDQHSLPDASSMS
jgi:hypothetical protein